MRKSSFVLPIFLILCALSGLIMLIASKGAMQFFTDSMEMVLFPVSSIIMHIRPTSSLDELAKLKQENIKLTLLLAKQTQLQQDNQALRDQFDSTTISSKRLLPVEIVGMPNVIPNVSFPETFVIGAGKKDRVQNGSVAIVKSEVIGIVTNASDHYASVQLVSNKQSSFSVKSLETGAIGVAKGQGNGEIVMDNILLSDTIAVGNTVVTLGNQDTAGSGYPVSLVVGKVVSVEKNPSSLFQKARVMPLVKFDQLSTVFIMQQ